MKTDETDLKPNNRGNIKSNESSQNKPSQAKPNDITKYNQFE